MKVFFSYINALMTSFKNFLHMYQHFSGIGRKRNKDSPMSIYLHKYTRKDICENIYH